MTSLPAPPDDWRGNPIEIGSVIVYATAASSSVHMNEAIVARIDFVPQTRYNYGPVDPVTKRRQQTPYTVYNPVLFVRKTREHGWSTSKNDQSKLQKLTRVDRVTVVEAPDYCKCNWEGCTATKGHDDATNPNYYPAHSWERED